MKTENNRVVDGMQEWLQREDNIFKLFSAATLRTKYFQELKVDYLMDLYRKIRTTASKDERMTLRILRGEMKQLERTLYPNILERLARKLYRKVKEVLEKREGIHVGEKTGWMMKVASRNVVNEKKERSQQTRLQGKGTGLVVKKRTSQGKGLNL